MSDEALRDLADHVAAALPHDIGEATVEPLMPPPQTGPDGELVGPVEPRDTDDM